MISIEVEEEISCMDENPNMSWYRRMELAIQNPHSCEMEELLSVVRGNGMNKLQSPGLRQAAGDILHKYGSSLSPSARWFVGRLQNAGYQPTYPDYLSLGILTPCPTKSCDAPMLAKNTFRLIGELSHHLLGLPELQDHAHHASLEKRVNGLSEKAHDHLFSMLPAVPPSSDLIRLSLVPESDVPDELIFIRVLQCSELVFSAAKDLVINALEWMSYGEILEVVRNLHWVNCLSDLVVPLLGVLSPMSKESWRQIRPLIMAPSAIQSPNFHNLIPNIDELARILQHPRLIQSQQRYLATAQELLGEAKDKFQTWERGHHAIAAKYNRLSPSEPKSDGLIWLESRRAPFESDTLS